MYSHKIKRSIRKVRKSPWAKGKSRCKPTKSIKSNPKLWERLKKSIIQGNKGGPSGKWSARKAQLLVAKYKKSGGKFKGKKSSCNSLTKWSKEQWGYVGKPKQSRYLQKKVRSMLTKKEKSIENRRKGRRYGKWIPYSKSVNKKMRKAGIY
jgi:hypothetical protein